MAPLESAVLARPQVVNARYNLGLAYAGTDREEWAEQEMLKTVSLEPRLAGAWAWLFRYYTGRKDERKAVGCVREWLRHRPADADAERLRGIEERLVRELPPAPSR